MASSVSLTHESNVQKFQDPSTSDGTEITPPDDCVSFFVGDNSTDHPLITSMKKSRERDVADRS